MSELGCKREGYKRESGASLDLGSDLGHCMDLALMSALGGPRCPQDLAVLALNILNVSLSPMSEDCLYLSVYTPAHAREGSRLPVSGRPGAAGCGRTSPAADRKVYGDCGITCDGFW